MQKASLGCQWEAYGPCGGLLPADGTVLLDGLQAKPELNGAEAKVLCWDAPSGRFAVNVSSSGARIKIKPSNLKTTKDSALPPWADMDHDWLLPMDLLLVVARCLSSRNVAVLSAGSRSARATLWLRPAAGPLWEELLVRGFGPLAAETVLRARPDAAGPSLCRCARALRRLFQQSIEIVPGSVHAQASGVEVVACPVLAGLHNVGIGAQGVVRRAAGRVLEEAVRKIPTPLEPASVVLVPGGPLAQYVALAVTEPPRDLLLTEKSREDRIRGVLAWLDRLHENLFRAVRDAGCRSLAMPTLCTGGIGMPVHWVATAAIRTAHREFCSNPTDPVRVRIACFDPDQIPSFNGIRDTVVDNFFRPQATEEVLVWSLFAPDDSHDFLV